MRPSDLLRRLIKELVLEISKNPRVANQLISVKGSSNEEKDELEDESEVDEMSVAANIAGPILPLGMDTPGKKEEPGWS